MIKIEYFKCPFCGGNTSYHKTIKSDGGTTAHIDCETSGPLYAPCGISINFGAFGKGVKDIDANVTRIINKFKP